MPLPAPVIVSPPPLVVTPTSPVRPPVATPASLIASVILTVVAGEIVESHNERNPKICLRGGTQDFDVDDDSIQPPPVRSGELGSRQRQCSGGEPIVTRVPRRRFVGIIADEAERRTDPDQVSGIVGEDRAEDFAEAYAEHLGSVRGTIRLQFEGITFEQAQRIHRENIDHPTFDFNSEFLFFGSVVSDVPSPMTSGPFVNRTPMCFYRVWLLTERRVCRCPDGSPCQSSRS